MDMDFRRNLTSIMRNLERAISHQKASPHLNGKSERNVDYFMRVFKQDRPH